MSDRPDPSPSARKITEGANERPRDASIGQNASGLPDDSSRPLEPADPQAERRMERNLRSDTTKDHS